MEIEQIEQVIASGLRWLEVSGVIHEGPESDFRNGVFGWYDMHTSEYACLYPEITAYAAQLFLYFGDVERAGRLCDWLIDHGILECGAVKTRIYPVPSDDPSDFSVENRETIIFDTAVAASSLFRMYLASGMKKYREAGIRCIEFVASMKKTDGGLYAAYDFRTKRKIDDPDGKFSRQGGAWLAKTAIAFCESSLLREDESIGFRMQTLAQWVCEDALRFRTSSGHFITNAGDGECMLHPYAYAIEGLAFAGFFLKNEKYLESATHALEIILENVPPDGALQSFLRNGEFNGPVRTDACAQILRMGCVLRRERGNRKWDEPLEALARFIVRMQKRTLDRCESLSEVEADRRHGGFLYSPDQNYLNTWVTIFAVQALHFYLKYLEGKSVGWEYS